MRIRTFSVHPPRHPVLRALMVICGAMLLVGLLTVGFLVGAAVFVLAAVTVLVRRLLHRSSRGEPTDPNIIEGEYTVVARPRAALPHPE